ncbi:MAG: metalloregulator ArsR/SmtB family transcription factor [Pseudolysinimonas sp.]|uniref:ArsR/SmtB family transcription factor n=1 Tax=Pseudolysinimonas sp. TaxID=2680009 RepID=UPI003267E45F
MPTIEADHAGADQVGADQADADQAGADALSSVFAALADPTRRAILTRLMTSDASVAELGQPFEMSQPAVSKHLRVLETAGLISRTKVATTRYSHLEAEPLKAATAWMQSYKRFWNESFDRLDTALAEYLAATTEPPTEPEEKDEK